MKPNEIVNWALGIKNESNPDDFKKQRIGLQDKADSIQSDASKEFKANGRSKKFLELTIKKLETRIEASKKQQDWYKAKGGEDNSPAAKILKISISNYQDEIKDLKKEMSDKKEDFVMEQTSPGVASFDKLKGRIDSKPIKDQLNFYKSYADKLQAMFMDETPSADSKFNKFVREIKSSFMDMIGGEEDSDGALEIDDMEDEEESLVAELADQEDYSKVEASEDDGDFETDEVEEATKKKKVIKSPYANKILKLKDKIDHLVWKKKAFNDAIKKRRESKKGLGPNDADAKERYSKEIENLTKKKQVLMKQILAGKGTLSAAREMNKKWKSDQKGKK